MAPESQGKLGERLSTLGRRLAAREEDGRDALDEARRLAAELRGFVAEGLEAYHRAVEDARAPQLRVELSEPRADDKHLRSVQFDLRRGRHAAIVTVKSRGDVTLVGPFRQGKVEGPCKSFPFAARDEIHDALGDFLESFLEAAATP